MMQSFTKSELAWIYNALKHEAEKSNQTMQELGENSPLFHLAELNRDNCRATMHKIHEAMNNGCKRIAIK